MSSSREKTGNLKDQLLTRTVTAVQAVEEQRFNVLLALADLIEETTTLREQGSAEEITRHFFEKNADVLRMLDTLPTLAAVEDDVDTVLQASELMQGIIISEHWGNDPLLDSSTEEHGVNLIALGLAAGLPQLVFVGQANRLVGRALQTDDPTLAATLIDELRRLGENESRYQYDFIIKGIPQAIGRLERLTEALNKLETAISRHQHESTIPKIAEYQQPEMDPTLERIDPMIAGWVAGGNTDITGKMHYRVMSVLDKAFKQEWLSQDIEYFYNAVISVFQIDQGFTTQDFSDKFLHAYLSFAHRYYRGMMERSTDEARAAFAEATMRLGSITPDRHNLSKKIPAMWYLGKALAADRAGVRGAEEKYKWASLARKGFSDVGNSIDEIEAMLLMGESLTIQGDQKNAFAILDQARVKAIAKKLLPEAVNACIGLAVLYYTVGLKKEAADLFIQFLAKNPVERLHDDRSRRAVAQAMTELALMYRATNNFKDYRQLINQAADLFNQANHPKLAEQARAR